MAKKTNFGCIKDSLVKNASSLYLNENKIDKTLKEFLNVVKSSPILTLEFIIYKNIENKHIFDDVLATRYIDENISMLKDFTKKEIIEENNKINNFISDDYSGDESKLKLYESIETIILENAKDSKFKNVDKIHTSFEYILNRIKNNKNNNVIQENKSVFEEYKDKYLNTDFIFNNAVKKFNEKYSHLSEGEKRILKIMINENDNQKEYIFNEIVTETLNKVESILKAEDNSNISNKLYKVKDKINEMKFNKETLVDDLVKLNTLKESL
jgi:hypothetical protein